MITIREATPSDIPVLETLYAAIGKKEEGYFARCFESGRRIFIAALDGREAGYGLLNFSPKYALYRKLEIPEIQDLNVIPDTRRNGVGAALISHCEGIIREAGHTQAGISVGLTKDYGPAQRLYAKLGYIPDGFGVTYDRQPVPPMSLQRVDDNLCLMLVKEL